MTTAIARRTSDTICRIDADPKGWYVAAAIEIVAAPVMKEPSDPISVPMLIDIVPPPRKMPRKLALPSFGTVKEYCVL